MIETAHKKIKRANKDTVLNWKKKQREVYKKTVKILHAKRVLAANMKKVGN